MNEYFYENLEELQPKFDDEETKSSFFGKLFIYHFTNILFNISDSPSNPNDMEKFDI